MNIKQIFLPLIGALALVGCNKEAVEPTSSNLAQPTSVTLALSLEGTADASEMRAVSFDANQNVPPTTHDQYSDWTTHCFLRNDDGSKKAYAVIHWDARVEGGKVKLKMRGHELNLLPIGSSGAELSPENKPVAGERWSIEGITGGGKLNSERTRVDFAPDADLDKNLQPHQARVPFTFEKTFFTVSASSGERAPQISVHFKPQGSLLNVHVNNATNRGKHAVSTDLKLYTNALSNNGYYDYSTGEAQWEFTNESAQEEVISRPITVDKDAAAKYVLWGMPRPEAAKPATGFKSEIYLGRYKIFAEGSTTAKPKVRDEAFVNGIAYPMGINIDRPFMPLEYVAEYNVAEDRASFATTHHVGGNEPENHQEYVTQQEALNLFSNIKIGGRGYHLPKFLEARGTALMRKELQDVDWSATPGRHTFEDQSLEIEGSTYEGYRDEVNILDFYTQYALRFVKDSSKDMVMAYRYVFDLSTPGNFYNHVTITSRYVGPKGVTLEEVSSPEYWNSNNEDDKSIRLPLVGFWDANPWIASQGSIGDYWIVPYNGHTYFLQGVLGSRYGSVRTEQIPTSNVHEYRFAVRLFSDRVY